MILKKGNLYDVILESSENNLIIYDFFQKRLSTDLILKSKKPVFYENMLEKIKIFKIGKIVGLDCEELIKFNKKIHNIKKIYNLILNKLYKKEKKGYSSFEYNDFNKNVELEYKFFEFRSNLPTDENFSVCFKDKDFIKSCLNHNLKLLNFAIKNKYIEKPKNLAVSVLGPKALKNGQPFLHLTNYIPLEEFKKRKPKNATIINFGFNFNVEYNGFVFLKSAPQIGISKKIIDEYETCQELPRSKYPLGIEIKKGNKQKIYETLDGINYRRMSSLPNLNPSPVCKKYNDLFNEELIGKISEPLIKPPNYLEKIINSKNYEISVSILKKEIENKKLKKISEIGKKFFTLVLEQSGFDITSLEAEYEFNFSCFYEISKFNLKYKQYDNITDFLTAVINEKENIISIFEKKLKILRTLSK